MSRGLSHLIVAYDVETVTPQGRRRLREVAQLCCAHGVRVQKSVFECALEEPQTVLFVAQLVGAIAPQTDSLRVYHLGNRPPRVQIHGGRPDLQAGGPWIV